MKVRTLKVGFLHGSIVEADTVTDIEPKLFSKHWMESLELEAEPAEKPKAEGKSKPPAAI